MSNPGPSIVESLGDLINVIGLLGCMVSFVVLIVVIAWR